jgi:hypothetical protein
MVRLHKGHRLSYNSLSALSESEVICRTWVRISCTLELGDDRGQILLNESPDLVGFDLRVLIDRVVPKLIDVFPRDHRVRLPE